jgi:glycosyltransferase involved in cell wall biosynthesis
MHGHWLRYNGSHTSLPMSPINKPKSDWYMESIIHPKVSVITVVYNDVEHIRETIESFFSQTWEEKEYIVIDGGSTDGTADVVREYADQLSYWCSEADKGIYDAMNKGIEKATGDWINFLNCGDYYATADSLRNVMESEHAETADVLFGDSIAVIEECRKEETAPSDVSLLEMIPTFRHGSSLIRTSVQRQYKFDLSRKQQLGYSLDWEMLYRVYKSGRRFCKVDTIIQAYLKEGISNHQYKNLWYNYLITSQGHFCPKKYLFFIRRSTDTFIKDSSLYRLMRDFLL